MEADAAREVFERFGIRDGVLVVEGSDRTEVIFIVDSSTAATLPEGALVKALMDTLRRKVWLATNAEDWDTPPRPLFD